MEFTLDEKYDELVQNAWLSFSKGEPFDTTSIRPEIYQSWLRCKKYGLDFSSTPAHTHILSAAELEKLLHKDALMYQVALPFMKQLYDVIRGSDSMVSLTNKDGYILDYIQDKTIIEYIEKNELRYCSVPGSNQSEQAAGTNDIALCLLLNKPMWVRGNEYFSSANKGWACFAAPIHNENNILNGVISVSTRMANAHKHTLGLAIAAARAISNEIQLQVHCKNLVRTNSLLRDTLESVSQGMIVIDNFGKIKQLNSVAEKMLYLEYDKSINLFVGDILIDENHQLDFSATSEISDQEILLKTSKGTRRYYLSTKFFFASDTDEPPFMLITLREIEHVYKFANKLAASQSKYGFQDIIGSSKRISDTIQLAKATANSSSTVLITGESGTGKELFAQSIHSGSPRRDGPFISLNCGALPAGLIESELFGYEGGSFTGARKEGQLGKFELAHTGTIFLDEIGDMPLAVQASILRVIQTREITRIGGRKPLPIDVRIIAATNKDLLQAIAKKDFREDLYYRLNVLHLHLPSLRERKEDIRDLADYFLAFYGQQLHRENLKIDPEGYRILEGYDWPGNIRQLENIIERAVNISESSIIKEADLLKYISPSSEPMNETLTPISKSLNAEDLYLSSPILRVKDIESKAKNTEHHMILRLLNEHQGNIAKCAESLGVTRRSLYRRLDEHQIDYQQYRKDR